MQKHEIIFEQLKEFLKDHFPKKIIENKEENHISVGETGIWIMSNNRELSIGYGLTHIHFDPNHDDIDEAIELFFNLLTCKKKITKYYKGKFSYKNQVDIILANNDVYYLGTAMTWLFPFWKKTIIKVEIENEIIELDKIKNDMDTIKTMHNSV